MALLENLGTGQGSVDTMSAEGVNLESLRDQEFADLLDAYQEARR